MTRAMSHGSISRTRGSPSSGMMGLPAPSSSEAGRRRPCRDRARPRIVCLSGVVEMGRGDAEIDADRVELHVGGMHVALRSWRAEASTRVDQEMVLADGVGAAIAGGRVIARGA